LGERDGYRNLNVLVREWGEEVIFLRKVVAGAADRSYGIEVARLAGVPETVVRRAAEILKDLERTGAGGIEITGEVQPAPAGQQLTLFGSQQSDWLLEELSRLDPDRLTPLDALALLSRWIRRVDAGGG
jgi:DNA mismatch repair protein MutS